MLQIICRNNNNQERIYAIDNLMHNLLGLEKNLYETVFRDDASSYCIKFC